MSPSLYGFVRGREPASPEEIAAQFLSLPHPNGDARALVEELVGDDPRFLWDGGGLRTADVASLALDDAPYVIFDLETTGSSAGKGGITELGALKLLRGQVVEEFSTLVNPGRPIEPFVVRLTGITDRMVAGAPGVFEAMTRFEEFVEGSVLVGHNVHFDCSFVTAAREGVPLPNPVLDTLRLARCLVPGLKRYRLASLVSHFGVRAMPNHRALSDAAATAGVFLRLLKLLRSAGVQSVGEAATLRGGRGGRVRPQKHHLAEGIPGTPGVYYFLDRGGRRGAHKGDRERAAGPHSRGQGDKAPPPPLQLRRPGREGRLVHKARHERALPCSRAGTRERGRRGRYPPRAVPERRGARRVHRGSGQDLPPEKML
ncbi:MAG: hypothetical protein LC714_03745 [Actinobacteria bacterium]|nr:hypothetical protein [Actinomycetota bacterium]